MCMHLCVNTYVLHIHTYKSSWIIYNWLLQFHIACNCLLTKMKLILGLWCLALVQAQSNTIPSEHIAM